MTLGEVERLCELATPGPWVHERLDFGEPTGVVVARTAGGARREVAHCDTPQQYIRATTNCAEFIAAAREWMPRLIEVAKAAHELGLYDDFGLSAEELADPGLPDEPAAYVEARQALHRALAALEPGEKGV